MRQFELPNLRGVEEDYEPVAAVDDDALESEFEGKIQPATVRRRAVVATCLVIFAASAVLILGHWHGGTTDRKEINLPMAKDALPGTWVHVGPNRSFAAPVCCGWDNKHFRRHPEQCGPHRTNSNNYQGTLDYYQQLGGHGCECDLFTDEYEWQSPDLPEFDALATCRQLKNRTVLVMGDSTLQQSATTIMNALRPGGCSPQITFMIADTLINKKFSRWSRGWHWLEGVEQVNPDIVILGVGAHIRSDIDYFDVLDEVITGIQELHNKTSSNKPIVVWKTQQPAGCTYDIFHPEDPTIAGKEFNFSRTPLYEERFQDKWYQRDLDTMEILRENGIPYLDMRMLYSRSDAHPGSVKEPPVDCLHMCSPGPLDVLAPMFQRLLLELDSKNS